MPWTPVTIRRRASVRMPDRCAYCNGPAERRLTLRAARRLAVHTGRLTRTLEEEHFEIPVPFCAPHGTRTETMRGELRRVRRIGGGAGALLGVVAGLFAVPGFSVVEALMAAILFGLILGALAFVATAIVARKLPRYRDYGAGLLGVDLAAGAEALTFRFTNAAYAATFRTRNGTYL